MTYQKSYATTDSVSHVQANPNMKMEKTTHIQNSLYDTLRSLNFFHQWMQITTT